MLFLLNGQLRAQGLCGHTVPGGGAPLWSGSQGRQLGRPALYLHNLAVSNALAAAAEMPAEAKVKAPGTNALTSRSRLSVCVPRG